MRRSTTWVICSLLALALVMSAVGVSSGNALAAPSGNNGSENVRVYVNGEHILWNDSAVFVNGKTLVPLASYLEALGARVSWDEARQTAKATLAGSDLEVGPNAKTVLVNGRFLWLDMPTVVVNGRIYIPVGMFSKLLGGTVRWDPVDQVIVIEFSDSYVPGEDDWPYLPPEWDEEPAGGQNGRVIGGLKYTVYYSEANGSDKESAGELVLAVTNVTNKPVTLQFGSSKTHDFVVRKNGQVVWSASSGKVYLPYIKSEVLRPWQTRLYKSSMPSLNRGWYTVDAYFGGKGSDKNVARTTIFVDGPRHDDLRNYPFALGYSLTFRPKTWAQGSQNRLAFEVRNVSGRSLNLYYPSGRSYTVVVVDESGKEVWRVSGTVYGGSQYLEGILETFSPGGVKHHFITLPSLSAGRYTAYAYYSPSGDRAVSSTRFTISR
jgi:hypothetical protein